MQNNSIENKQFVTVMLKMVGTNCNMNCVYCYERASGGIYNKLSTSSQVIKYLASFVDYEHVFIIFHGGEPLLASKNEVRKILNFIKKNFTNKHNIQFQTNGTLLDDEWISLFKQYEPNLSLSISLDPLGEKDLRNMKSVSYREIVERNLKKYCSKIQNIGVIAVAHKYNYRSFVSFIRNLIRIGIKSLTINKFRTKDFRNKNYLTEKEYVEMLKEVFVEWVSNGWYKSINVQPLSSLFSPYGSKICIYLPDEHKCRYFKTYYSENEQSDYCDHMTDGYQHSLDKKCLDCEIYSKCGGGCLAEAKDDTFCDARKELFNFIEGVKHGNK